MLPHRAPGSGRGGRTLSRPPPPIDLGTLTLEQRAALPEALRVLLQDYPREAWAADPGFSDLIRFWLERHLMFRRLLEVVTGEVEDTLDARMDRQEFAAHTRRYAAFFIQELHMHHTVEDQHYFPRLQTLDARLGWGFDLLDNDHHEIDGHLQGFADDANTVLDSIAKAGDPRPHLDAFHQRLIRTTRVLDRHLSDEEDLVVPVLLKHAPSGLV